MLTPKMRIFFFFFQQQHLSFLCEQQKEKKKKQQPVGRTAGPLPFPKGILLPVWPLHTCNPMEKAVPPRRSRGRQAGATSPVAAQEERATAPQQLPTLSNASSGGRPMPKSVILRVILQFVIGELLVCLQSDGKSKALLCGWGFRSRCRAHDLSSVSPLVQPCTP